MNKRKTSRENARPKTPTRRASIASLTAKPEPAMQKPALVEKSPSVHNMIAAPAAPPALPEEVKPAPVSKAVEACIPKTRFKPQDNKDLRNIPSPRLKSFPTEKIRKFENPVQSPRTVAHGNYYVPSNAAPIHGQGDSTRMLYQQNMENAMQSQAMAQQANQQLAPIRPNSEGTLAQPTVPPNYQVHRPFVPSTNHGTVQQNVKQGNYTPRDGAMYRQAAVEAMPNQAMSSNQLIANQFSSHNSPQSSPSDPRAFHPQGQQYLQVSEPQQMYQQRSGVPQQDTQQQAPNQQGIPQSQVYMLPDQQAYVNYYQQLQAQQGTPRNYPGPMGMTSPQDVIINQIKNSKNVMYSTQQAAGNVPMAGGYIIPPENGWVHPNQVGYRNLPNQQAVHPGNMENKVQTQNGERMPQEHAPPQQTTGGQDKETFSKPLQFTPDMLQDQELLLNTMRQQGVPEEVMRRQFDGLLREQRKQLVYIAQLKEKSDDTEVKRPEAQPRKRIGKHDDEKPEWMVHITPPRYTYTDAERVRGGGNQNESKGKDQSDGRKKPQEVTQPNQMDAQQMQYQHAQKQGQQYGYWQQPPAGYQEQPGYPHPRMNQYPYQNNMAQQPKMQNMQHNYQFPPGHPYWNQNQANYSQSGAQNQQMAGGNANSNDRKRAATEPSSLLKIKQYKEIVCPRNRNNGLQDMETVQKMTETLRSQEPPKGMEYLANMDKQKGTVKLNGVQESKEVHPDLIQTPPAETALQRQKRIAANGLENKRNAGNKVPRPRLAAMKTSQSEAIREYPRQKQYNTRGCYSIQPERDPGQQPPQNYQQNYQQSPQNYQHASQNYISQQQCQGYDKLGTWTHNQATPVASNMPQQAFNSCPQQAYSTPQMYQARHGEGDIAQVERLNPSNFNGAAGDAMRNSPAQAGGQQMAQNAMAYQQYANPQYKMNYNQQTIHEPKTIGGLKYLARKPMYIPTQRMSMPDASMPNMHMQAVANA